jgi:hypothetical protein
VSAVQREVHSGRREPGRALYGAGALGLAALTLAIFAGAGRLPSGVQSVLGFSVIFFAGALLWAGSTLRRRAGSGADPARTAAATLNAYGIVLVVALVGYYLLRDEGWAWLVGLLPAAVCVVGAWRVARG